MLIDRRLVGFGLFLITLGGVMVAVRQGLLGEGVARQAWTLWPVILIGAGLSIVLAGRPGASIGGLVLAVTFGAILGGVAATGVFPRAGVCSAANRTTCRFANRANETRKRSVVSRSAMSDSTTMSERFACRCCSVANMRAKSVSRQRVVAA